MLFIIIAILVFGILIAVHEFGHFTAAKLLGVRVNEFSIGMGPTILKKQGKVTKYSLRAFPIGGFCAMEGEDETSDDPEAFTSQPVWKRLIILCAGAFMNFLVGFIIVLVLFLPGKQYTAPVIGGFLDGFPYEGENGLMVGDRILSIDGEKIYAYDDISTFLRRGDYIYDIVIKRGGEKMKLTHFELIPQEYEFNGQTGKSFGFYLTNKNAGFLKNAELSWLKTRQFVRLVRLGLSDLIKGNASVKDLSGPVGIVSYMSDVGNSAESASEAAYSIAFLCAFIA
ncbi:MAG: site-2 protease family protein, partial [Oscillospiraceae bacterium]|nr:site-2 protease family protein [Oscillospiraceae bacterium]